MRSLFVLVAVLIAAVSCNRAALRIPAAAGSFHPAVTKYHAVSTKWGSLQIAVPIDERAQHYGERVAGTRWEACSTDPFWNDSMPVVLGRELERETRASGLFAHVATAENQRLELVLETRVHALCAQAIGFLFVRVAGISSLHFTLRNGDEVLFDDTIERVVTDADPAYTGSQVSTIEQAMMILLSDNLRNTLLDLFYRLDALPAR